MIVDCQSKVTNAIQMQKYEKKMTFRADFGVINSTDLKTFMTKGCLFGLLILILQIEKAKTNNNKQLYYRQQSI